jgi:hypothetical protein
VTKIIFWIVVVFVVLFALRLINVAKARRTEGGERQTQNKQPKAADAMVRCSECGIFLPKAEALASPQGFRCSDPDCAKRHGNPR